jgi:hypothetical protein
VYVGDKLAANSLEEAAARRLLELIVGLGIEERLP